MLRFKLVWLLDGVAA